MRRWDAILLSVLFSANAASAATIAVIDSGVDLRHQDLVQHAWVNSSETEDNFRDDDNNGYIDDVFGWNFADNNNQVIDYKYIGKFSKDVYRFFDLQKKLFNGTITIEERSWASSKSFDRAFARELSIFGNFMHGTHVAAIAAKDNAGAKVLAVKLIGTDVPMGPGEEPERPTGAPIREIDFNLDKMIKGGLAMIAEQQSQEMAKISKYIAAHEAEVANGSFGAGGPQAMKAIARMLTAVLQRDPTAKEVAFYTKYLLDKMVEGAQDMVGASPETLFVFAAGNDGTDNDVLPSSPSNVRADNSLAVAATFGRGKLAQFSNFGKTTVDVAAPGVLIESAIPGNEYLFVSGTSQAAPYVSNAAARVKDVNPDLSPKEIKTILMETVDVKDWLRGKVISSGVVNPKRAERAAELSKDTSLSQAIAQAKRDVRDLPEIERTVPEKDLFVMPLPSLVNFKLSK